MWVRQVLWLPVQWEILRMMIHFADKRGVDVTISRSTLKCKNDQIDLESPHLQYSAPIPYSIRAYFSRRIWLNSLSSNLVRPSGVPLYVAKEDVWGRVMSPFKSSKNNKRNNKRAFCQKTYRDLCVPIFL